mmetsp:Transcript_13507/g.31396  ORF Transcript_13507/g.31396 Transcript_13507/m.31396 type:complete len:495 (-) Transcript_13507:739-2223(-)
MDTVQLFHIRYVHVVANRRGTRSYPHKRVESGHRLRQRGGLHTMSNVVSRRTTKSHQTGHLDGASHGRIQMTQCGGHTKCHTSLSRYRTQTSGSLRSQTSNTTNAQQSRQGGSSCIDLGELARHDAGSIQTQRGSSGNSIEMVIFRRVIRTLEHVQHFGRYNETTDNVDRGKSGSSSSKQRDGRVVGVRKKMHTTQGGGTGNGIGHCHEWAVEGMGDTQHNLHTNHVAQRKRGEHGTEGGIWCNGTHGQHRGCGIGGCLGSIHVGCTVINLHFHHFGLLLFSGRWWRRKRSWVHHFALLQYKHSTNRLVLVINVEVSRFFCRLGSGTEKELGNIVGIETGGGGGKSRWQIGVSQTRHTIVGHNLAIPHGGFDVPTRFGCQIDGDGSGLHLGHHVLGNHDGCLATRNEGRGNDNVHFLTLLGKHTGRSLVPLFGHFLGVPTGAGSILLEINLQKLASHGLDLFLGHGTHVKSPNDGSHVLGRLHGRQTCHTGSNH